VRGLPLGQVYDLRGGSARLDRLNALMGTFPGLVALAGGDGLAVGGLQVEPKLAGFVLNDLELGLPWQFSLFGYSNSGNAAPR
jgi:hypothetical protein